tara:strand:+ start:3302 stop:3622 length:321 start_codon:yes stop_codon:yes gene_type:complete
MKKTLLTAAILALSAGNALAYPQEVIKVNASEVQSNCDFTREIVQITENNESFYLCIDRNSETITQTESYSEIIDGKASLTVKTSKSIVSATNKAKNEVSENVEIN